MKKTLIILALALCAFPAHAQQAVSPCTKTTNSYGVTSCVPVTSSTPLPTTTSLAPATGTGSYAAVTVGSSSGQALAAAATRKFLQIFNASSSATVACNIGGAAVINGAGSITLLPGQAATWDGSYVPADAVNCIASSGSTPATIGSN